MPKANGKSVSVTSLAKVWPNGRSTSGALSNCQCNTTPDSSGKLTGVIRLMSAVSETDSATVPRARYENRLDTAPPGLKGQHYEANHDLRRQLEQLYCEQGQYQQP